MKTDYLILGSGLSALVFGSLMAKSGHKVQILEAHEHPGGFGHTFTMAKKYKFNAQLHYVWDCGEGHTVNRVLKKLNLDQDVTFTRYDPNGFDHMRMPGYSLNIPSEPAELIRRLSELFPQNAEQIRKFVWEVQKTSQGIKKLSPPMIPAEIFAHFGEVSSAVMYLNSTLQDVFDKFKLPPAAQTLLALQWPDFLLPPNQVSFYAWVILFTGYQQGAFYPEQHFDHVINSLVKVIEDNGGEILLNQEVTDFQVINKTVTKVKAINRITHQSREFTGENIICNIDPQKAAQMIGVEKFSRKVRQKLNYEYSPSNFMAYCVVKDIDLRDYGFGKWNVFHTSHQDLNEAFYQMYEKNDFSQPSFAITTPSLMTEQPDSPEGCQIIEFLTVANYDYFKQLKDTDVKAYRQKKAEILDAILDVVEKHYIPNIRNHLDFKITGSPTTNERYCWCPKGNSYGSNLTPGNMGIGRLNYQTSLKNLYFCNASSGYPGFAPTFWTGASLYQKLSGDVILPKG
ncbi:NAD(P)/FAD-dependent oxidoreductase [Nodularia spumigena CS-584]|jgi:all-trans-retinol 13,14-reductase|uniref:phytoene desaturase family protein n=1 Tax=Nodularia spumigena TaxID=70799 RepID=UPI0000EABB1E|nr:NAD(P)/FAD-dependent oxidoreductase [Nodularia spumigena]AHJ26686.1 Phytoene desaturase, neurosporene or lycopene producing [Nodularia spumigena CCY9414]EAW43584.1 FAD dependent oxidoreductase [Nodularia spumigena CCY9414]MDB9381038.1 NAD(P)/FAD-dependent oxidoreductase [Nodularia spumigena CS-584]MEA5556771.1 NAD(P)/FAD-dependent oxidoreductase [Nodularia spumigena CH309]